MGGAVSWPALSETTRSVPRSSSDASRIVSDGSVPSSQVTVRSYNITPPQRSSHNNANNVHGNSGGNNPNPARLRGIAVVVLVVGVGRGPRPIGGGVGPSHSGNDHSTQRINTRRNNNYGLVLGEMDSTTTTMVEGAGINDAQRSPSPPSSLCFPLPWDIMPPPLCRLVLPPLWHPPPRMLFPGQMGFSESTAWFSFCYSQLSFLTSFDGDMIRRRNDWSLWIGSNGDPSSSGSISAPENALAASLNEVSVDDATTHTTLMRTIRLACDLSLTKVLHSQGMAGKAVKSVAKAVGEYQFPWKEKLTKYRDELSKGVWGYWELGAWKPLAISARRRARIRKEVLLAGGDWEFDPERKEMKTKRKGHKVDRLAAEKRANTARLMEEMPKMLDDYKKRRWERKMKAEEDAAKKALNE
ncbi:hypothetical protein SASPL_113073 [Salvia splendens]|uniref:Uncharacterized protein n=1 Tax=Salvia splendens TaxID=180675 RepID=A0A8X8XZC2_SALSN|nr:hypothetical protein SASPL_113073 [Salvia splendens]